MTELRRTEWTAWQLHLDSNATSAHDRVLREVVEPAVRGLPGRPWFFIRFWQGGPHLRLRVGDLDPAERDKLAVRLAAGLATAGSLRGDEARIDNTAYAASAARLAAAESGSDRVVRHVRAPGVYDGDYEPEYARYGGTDLMPRTETLFQLSSELVLALLPHVDDRRRRAMAAIRGTMAAAAVLGDRHERSYFYLRGVESWREFAVRHGYTNDQVDELCRVLQMSPLTGERDDHGPFKGWHQALIGLADEVRRTLPVHPGAILSSHVHMLHNRLGLTLPDELRTYAVLSHMMPVPETPRQ